MTKEGPMIYQTETKPQLWRAVAVFEDRPDQLIYLNRLQYGGLRRLPHRLHGTALAPRRCQHVRTVSLNSSAGKALRLRPLGPSGELDRPQPGTHRPDRRGTTSRRTDRSVVPLHSVSYKTASRLHLAACRFALFLRFVDDPDGGPIFDRLGLAGVARATNRRRCRAA